MFFRQEVQLLHVDTRINLDLNTTHGYYRAKKILMEHYKNHNMESETISFENLSTIINANQKKYKFDSKSQNSETLQKLMDETQNEINNNINIDTNIKINKIIHSIRTAITARGTSPTTSTLDLWGLNNRWINVINKGKYNSTIGKNYDRGQLYSGSNHIKKGLEYIKKKISNVDDHDQLYFMVKQKLEKSNKLSIDGNVAKILLSEMIKIVSKKNDARSIALISLIKGYQELSERLELDKPNPSDKTNKIIELLCLQELHTLISQDLTTAKDEKKLEVVYRSCIDLFSVMIASRLESESIQAVFTSDEQVIFPKAMSHTNLKSNTSNILINGSGREALVTGLKVLCKSLPERLPGFRLTTVLSQGDAVEEEKDIAVYYELGGKRGQAAKFGKNDDIAGVGRTTETKFDINQDDINRLNKDVIEWCQNNTIEYELKLMSSLPENDINKAENGKILPFNRRVLDQFHVARSRSFK